MTKKLTHLALYAATLVFTGAAIAEAQPRGRARGRVSDEPAPIRFQELDRNHDGIIQRAEWTGSTQSFRVHDWNNDNMLSGDEVRVGAERPGQLPPGQIDRTSSYEFDDWTSRGFAALDRNRDGRVTTDEWRFAQTTFRRADHNRDGAISRAEFLAEGTLTEDRSSRFDDLDVTDDGRISRLEWRGTEQAFNTLDVNRDGMISRAEFRVENAVNDERDSRFDDRDGRFDDVDVTDDGRISRLEWRGTTQAFDSLDTNRDGMLSRSEFERSTPQAQTRSTAYRAGYERGAAEARAQAREDRLGNHGYDPTGQRELETADSGYSASLGSRTDYQAGYREGWMRGYPEGWRS